MNTDLRRLMTNSVRLAIRLKPGEKITREQIIDILRERLPDVEESEATLRHSYKHHILNCGIDKAEAVITYEEGAKLAETTIDALRAAAYRGQLVKLGTVNVEGYGRTRQGITLRSLAEFKRWSLEKFQEAAREVAKWREAEKNE